METPASRVVFEMIVRVWLRKRLQTLPAKLGVAPLAVHFVASLDLLNRELALRTLLGAILNVKQVESLVNESLCSFDSFSATVKFHSRLFTAFERVPLF